MPIHKARVGFAYIKNNVINAKIKSDVNNKNKGRKTVLINWSDSDNIVLEMSAVFRFKKNS